jgi:hypothetical protein
MFIQKFSSRWLLGLVAILTLSLTFTSFINPIQTDAAGGPTPSLNLIVNRKMWTGSSWGQSNLTNGGNFAEWFCIPNSITLDGELVKGITDYEDGISKAKIKQAEAEITGGSVNIDSRMSGRDCANYQVQTRNWSYPCPGDYTLPATTLTENYDFTTTSTAANCNTDQEVFIQNSNFPDLYYMTTVAAEKEVYAYQFQYLYNFPDAQSVELSEQYRSLTGMEGSYNAVMWTYTLYTYYDDTTGSYIPWENPNKENANGGFLVYGLVNGL